MVGAAAPTCNNYRMAPLICLVVSFLVFRISGVFVPYFADWKVALRAALGAMFLLTASAHLGRRRLNQVRWFPEPSGEQDYR